MREFAREFYSSAEWKKTRREFKKMKGGLCERCLAKGLISPGEIVHHKIYLTPMNINEPSIALDFNNLELLCRQCHADTHEGQVKRWRIENGQVMSVW